VDHNGRPFKLSQLQGRVALMLFGFTNCPDVCPLAMESMQQLADSGRVDTAEVAFVLISVDGARDTPAVMKNYLSRFSPDFIGLTDAPNVVKPIARAFSASFFKGGEAHDGHYNVSHSPQVFVVDRGGRLRAEFYTPSIEAMAAITNALLQESR
jgi:protein SCO1/2